MDKITLLFTCALLVGISYASLAEEDEWREIEEEKLVFAMVDPPSYKCCSCEAKDEAPPCHAQALSTIGKKTRFSSVVTCSDVCADFGRKSTGPTGESVGTCGAQQGEDCRMAPLPSSKFKCCQCASEKDKEFEKCGVTTLTTAGCGEICEDFGRFEAIHTKGQCPADGPDKLIPCPMAVPTDLDVIPSTKAMLRKFGFGSDSYDVDAWLTSHPLIGTTKSYVTIGTSALVDHALKNSKLTGAQKAKISADNRVNDRDDANLRFYGSMAWRVWNGVKNIKSAGEYALQIAVLAGTGEVAGAVIGNILAVGSAISAQVLMPLMVPFSLLDYVVMPWFQYVKDLTHTMDFWTSMEKRFGCLKHKMNDRVWTEKFQISPTFNSACPDLKYQAQVQKAAMATRLALTGAFDAALQMSSCYAVGGSTEASDQTDKNECFRMSQATLLDPEHGLLSQFVFRAQLFAGYMHVVVGHTGFNDLGLGLMNTLFDNLGLDARNRMMEALEVTVKQMADSPLDNLSGCGGILLGLAQFEALFQAFTRSIKLFASKRTAEMWRTPTIGAKTYPCRAIFQSFEEMQAKTNGASFCKPGKEGGLEIRRLDELRICSAAYGSNALWSVTSTPSL